MLNSEHKYGVLMGDMNVDLLKFNDHTQTGEYLDNIFSHGFLPVISRPTRVCRSSATLIDHIYINNITDQCKSGIVINDVADHYGIFYCVKQKHTDKHFTSYMSVPVSQSMFLEPVSELTVIETSKKLKSKSSSGHDEISTNLLKETIDIVIKPITHIVNKSFDAGIVPSNLKIAKVVPIFKANDDSLLKNYRPVSLLPAFSKLLEKLMYDKLLSFLNSKNILYKHQYGFRSKHSTIHPVIHLLNEWAMAANKNDPEFTLTILCDLSKAFDVIDHKILLHKLHQYGIRGIVNKWFENYLKDRTQFVNFDDNNSTKRHILCGVPQGSILGPLLYLIYVNDIAKACDSNIFSFADDTTMVLSHSNLQTLFANANAHMNELYMWFCANKLSLNAGKTKYIVIRPKKKMQIR